MPVSDDVVERAKRGDLASCEALLAESYPSVLRMSRALTGDAKVAADVSNFVLSRGIRVLPTWRRGTMPENWFYHHTLLAARERAASRPPPEPRADLLLSGSSASAPPDPGYVAFVRAVRSLPAQQCEAFLLHHGERLNPRLLGVAMDCSSAAAENHLSAATTALSAVAGPSLAPYAAALSRAYLALGPAEAEIAPAVHGHARRFVAPLRLKRLVRRLVLLVVLIALAWAAWHWRQEWIGWLSPWIDKLRGGRAAASPDRLLDRLLD